MNVAVWIEPNVAQAGIWAVVILIAVGACVWLRGELFPKRSAQ
jgi:hypothetical protein